MTDNSTGRCVVFQCPETPMLNTMVEFLTGLLVALLMIWRLLERILRKKRRDDDNAVSPHIIQVK